MLRIVSVETRSNTYMITVTLSDGRTTDFDVSPLLWGPAFEPLKQDRALFDSVKVADQGDTVSWPTGADIAPETLLAGLNVPAR